MLERYVVVAPWIVFGVVWLLAAPFTKKTVRRESMGSRWLYLAPVLVVAVLLESHVMDGSPWLRTRIIPLGMAMRTVCLLMEYAGVAFAIWARATLGSLWSGTITLKEDHRLVQSGPFSITRHPIYTGILFAASGLAMYVGTPGVLLGLAVLVLSFVVKLSREEKLMAKTFGEEHRAYRGRVRRLIPYVW